MLHGHRSTVFTSFFIIATLAYPLWNVMVPVLSSGMWCTILHNVYTIMWLNWHNMTHVPVETILTDSSFPPNRAILVTSSMTCSLLMMMSPRALGPAMGRPITTTPSLRLLTEIAVMSLRGNCSFTLKLLVSTMKKFCGVCEGREGWGEYT